MAAGVVGAALDPPQAASAPPELEEEGAGSALPVAMAWGPPGPVGGEAVAVSAPATAEGLGVVLVLGVLLAALVEVPGAVGVALVLVLEALGDLGALGVALVVLLEALGGLEALGVASVVLLEALGALEVLLEVEMLASCLLMRRPPCRNLTAGWPPTWIRCRN